jgi:hypothetical protein
MRVPRPVWVGVAAAVTSAIFLIAQDKPAPAAPRPTPPAKTKAPEPKLTPQQERGSLLLKNAEAEATGLQPDMRAYIQLLVARGYQKTDPRKAITLLEQAFTATEAITVAGSGDCWKDEACRTRQWLQTEILRDLSKLSSAKTRALVSRLDQSSQDQVNAEMLGQLIEQKKFDEARELLESYANKSSYPYGQAFELMKALPASSQQERVAIATQALNNLERYSSDAYPSGDDFAAILSRFWRDLPPELAMQGADAVLKQAKEADEKEKQKMWIQTLQGADLRFASLYELRLFELLPIMQQLDKGHAESLLREYTNVKAALDQYPQALQSMPSQKYTDPEGRSQDLPGWLNFGVDFDGPQEGQEMTYFFRQVIRINQEAGTDPQQALSDALALPKQTPSGPHLQASALMTVARQSAKRAPDVARTALAEVRKQLDAAKPLSSADQLLDATDLYLTMGDQSDAVDTLKEASKLVEKLYARDSNSGDLNLAFKGNWPSSALWERCVQSAARVSAESVTEIMSTVPDPEIQAFLRARYAAALMGFNSPHMVFVEKHKDGRSIMGSY